MDKKIAKPIPVITIDGLSGTGKGTISQLLAAKLGWHYLDSGALYRALAWAVQAYQISITDPKQLAAQLNAVNICLGPSEDSKPTCVICNGQDITEVIRTEECSKLASKISSLPEIRQILLIKQRRYRQLPGLVTDGRDMGSVIFPDAQCKIFLEATVEVRAKRRFNQLKAQRISASLRAVEQALASRDERDQNRKISRAKPQPDMVRIDTSELSIDEVLTRVLAVAESKGLVTH